MGTARIEELIRMVLVAGERWNRLQLLQVRRIRSTMFLNAEAAILLGEIKIPR